MSRELTVGSLFSGIGGFDLGLERAGMRVLWQCDNDPYAQRVLAKHWPDVLRLPDIRGVRAGTVPRVDVVVGGFPCQDISLLGKGAGLAGERSGLWFEYARVIRELRPRYVIVENVRALVVRGLDTVLGTLAEIGYDAEWDCLPASAFGAPHQRDRIWLVAYPAGGGSGTRGTPGGPEAGPDDWTGRAGLADTERERSQGHGRGALRARTASRGGAVGDADSMARPSSLAGDGRPGEMARPEPIERALGPSGSLGDHWRIEPDVGRVADGVPARVDRLRALGNALVPQIAEWIGRRILEHEGLA